MSAAAPEQSVLAVRHVTRDEAERMSDQWTAGLRWLICDAHDPGEVHHQRSMLGLPTGAEYLIGAISEARSLCKHRGYRLVLSPEMAAFAAAKDGLELALKRAAATSEER